MNVLVNDRSTWLDVFIHDWDRRPISVMVLSVLIRGGVTRTDVFIYDRSTWLDMLVNHRNVRPINVMWWSMMIQSRVGR